MNKKEIQQRLCELYESGSENIIVECWQDQPNTAVRVRITSWLPSHPTEEACGFAKVQWPDEFDAERGKDLAVRKALAKIARKLADPDLYTLAASRIFEVPADEVTPEQRQTAKEKMIMAQYGRSPSPNS